MSIPTTAAEVLTLARREIGVHESPAGSNRQKYGEWARDNGVAWCAIFVTYIFAHAGYDWRPLTSGFAYTPTLEKTLRKNGFRRVANSNAQPGDIVFFDFPDSVYRIQHVGIVEGNDPIHGRQLTTIEGNTSQRSDDNGGEVQRRYRPYGHVASILRPPYAVPAPKPVLTRTLKLTKPRMFGRDVLALRKLLGLKPWPFFDLAAAKALKKWQKVHGLEDDGQFGPDCCAKAGWVWRG